MLKKLLTLRASNSISFLTTGLCVGTLATHKVICRTLMEQDVDVVEKWDLLSAVCLERHPVITKPMLEIEIKYQNMLQQIEFESSLLSDFEIQKQKQKKLKQEDFVSQNVISNQIVQDLQDSWEEELKKFKFASKTSEVEEDNTIMSLRRKLDKNLILLVEQKVGNSSLWIPPQTRRKHRETMIQTAHRSLQEACGDNMKIKFYGNAPIGFYQYKYPKSVQETGQNGAKIFYFLAKYISGDISHNIKHCWLDREELKKFLHPAVHKSLHKFLIPD